MRPSVLMLLLGLATTLLAEDRDLGPPPGQLVDVGGRKLHILCVGEGAPTVVLEAGASSFAIDWSLVQKEIARTNRVCAHDRAGHGWSDPVTDVSTPDQFVKDLHEALAAAGAKPPYVLVGASLGGIYARLYQLEHPEEVAGMVLVDPSSEDRLFTLYKGKGVLIAELTEEQLRSTIPQVSVKVPRREAQKGSPFDRLPQEIYARRIALDQELVDSVPEVVPYEVVLTHAMGEHAALAKLRLAKASQEHPLRNAPLVVLTRGVGANDEVRAVHARLARMSTNSRHSVVPESGHEIHLFQPQAVVQAVCDVVDSIRSGQPLRAR